MVLNKISIFPLTEHHPPAHPSKSPFRKNEKKSSPLPEKPYYMQEVP